MTKIEEIIDALKNVYDPEIPVNIVDLGLIYEVNYDETERKARIKMTLTAPGCPMGNYIIRDAEMVVREVEGVDDVEIVLTYDPPWSPEMISDNAKKDLGYE